MKEALYYAKKAPVIPLYNGPRNLDHEFYI